MRERSRRELYKHILDHCKQGKRGCLLWQGFRGRWGYGLVGALSLGKRQAPTHRVMKALTSSFSIKSRKKVLHRCDIPNCVNPKHLFVGTQGDNVRDCVAKRRHARGTLSPRSKFQVRFIKGIRALKRIGFTQPEIARLFKTTPSNVSFIVRHKTWKELI